MPTPTAAQRRAIARIAAELGEVGFALPGTIAPRHVTCGKPSCRCAADPPVPHGPYPTWTRKDSGRTVSRHLTEAQYAAYAPWFEAGRRTRTLLRELYAISIEAADAELRPSVTKARRPSRKTPAS